ncbi:hypothetical protein A4E84_34550 [Streptomyces qaidamensis]|uniref:Uncharacterized protein n=1 Tax=Streptomyces qaidamensis TaxID=1783515 RepID=A0A143CB45_9ACTN|nr:hypothetical protein A4E84_34550 [Streptomyces qaidamensis]
MGERVGQRAVGPAVRRLPSGPADQGVGGLGDPRADADAGDAQGGQVGDRGCAGAGHDVQRSVDAVHEFLHGSRVDGPGAKIPAAPAAR